MNTELLLREFDRLSEAPDAVARLRGFIRDLAIAGRFDGREAGGKVVCVRDVANCRLGKMLDKSKNRGSLRRYLRNVNVRWNAFDLSDVKEMRFEDTEINEFTLRVGDVLVCEGGEPGRAAVWDRREEGILFQKAIHRVRLAESVDPHYFVLVLRQAADSGRLSEYFTGATFKHLTGMGLARFSFPLPSFAEQQRIIAKMNDLMTVCDEFEIAQERRERRRKDLSAASLVRLTSPGKVDGKDANFLLSHSGRLVTRSAHVVNVRHAILDLAIGQKLRAGRSTSVIWAEHRLGDLLAEDSRNGYSRKPDGAPDGIPILKISAGTIRRDGIVDEGECKLIGKVTPSERSTYELREGDLLACRFNGNREAVGRLTMFCDEAKTAPIFPDKLIRIRVDRTRVLPSLLRWFSRSQLIANRIAEFSATTVGNWGISAANLKRVTFPVPPMDEQHALIAKVDELMAVCDELERSLEAAQARRTRALEAILHQVLEEAGSPLPGLLEAVR